MVIYMPRAWLSTVQRRKIDAREAAAAQALNGVYGVRFAHITEATVSGFSMTKP